jgi:hypothetical protein
MCLSCWMCQHVVYNVSEGEVCWRHLFVLDSQLPLKQNYPRQDICMYWVCSHLHYDSLKNRTMTFSLNIRAASDQSGTSSWSFWHTLRTAGMSVASAGRKSFVNSVVLMAKFELSWIHLQPLPFLQVEWRLYRKVHQSELQGTLISSTLKMKGASSCETVVTIYKITPRHMPEDDNLS